MSAEPAEPEGEPPEPAAEAGADEVEEGPVFGDAGAGPEEPGEQ